MTTATHQEGLTTSTLRHRQIGKHTESIPIITARASRSREKPPSPPTGCSPLLTSTANDHFVRQRTISVGITVVVTLVLIGVFQLLWAWGTMTYQTLRYGYPRTTQIDAVVGHQDSATHPTHLIALNLQGRIEIIELPGGDSSQAKILQGPQMSGEHADLAPVILQLVKREGEHIPDLQVQCNGIEVWYRNENGHFTSA